MPSATIRRSRTITRIGVIGAGQMGGGIAQVAAQAGFDVRLMDVSRQALDAAISRIDYFLGRQVGKGVLTESRQVGGARSDRHRRGLRAVRATASW